MLTPERAVDIQCLLGADIQMQLDECIELPAEHKEAERAMELSLRWAERARDAFAKRARRRGRRCSASCRAASMPGCAAARRKRSSAWIFPATRVGGLAVGEGQELMLATLEGVLPFLPADKPRYLMGVGSPSDLIHSVARGVDMFDCVLPTRNGRHGLAFTWNGKVNLRNAKHAEDAAPLDPESTCPAARDYSRAYLHHLIKSGEYLGAMLLSWVNTAFYQELMAAMRGAIAEGRFASWAEATLARLDGER